MIRKGTMLVLETGEYSDKEWHGPFHVDKDLDLRAERERFWKAGKSHPWDFIAWLAKEGYVTDIDFERVHIGSYGQVTFDE